MAIAFAIAAALCFGASGITTARGIQNTNLVSALLVSLSVTAAVAMAFVLIDIPQQVSIGAVALFVAAGLLGDGVGRASFFRGVDRLGPSTTTPILTASYPLIAFVGGILLFSEAVTIWRVLGAACIVAGIWALTGTRDHDPGDSPSSRFKRWWRWAYLLPVAAGVAFAFSDLFRKSGLDSIPHPAFGAAVSAVTVFTAWLIIALAMPRVRGSLHLGHGWQWFIGTGVLVALGVMSVFSALDRGDVSVVGPIVTAQPLVVVALSVIFLRDLERVTWRTASGAALTVAGVLFIAITP